MQTLSQTLRGFSIRLRMLGAIVMVLALMVLLGAAALLGMARLDAAATRFEKTTHSDVVALAELRLALGNVRRFEKDAMLNVADKEATAAYLVKWQQAVDDTRKLAQALAGPDHANLDRRAGEVDNHMGEYLRHFTPYAESLRQGAIDKSDAGKLNLKSARGAAHKTEAAVAEMAQQLKADAAAAKAERAATTQTVYLMFGAVLVLAVLIVTPLTMLNSRSITEPIAYAARVADSIAAGDLTQPISSNGSDEAAELLRSLARMQASLGSVVSRVHESSMSIQHSSAEVASGNMDLSQRTEQAASSLQHTASSIEQLTATVSQSADSARQASQLASSAAQVAERGGHAVAQVVSTMNEINASSRRIGDIIGTIDGIAFQTNLLALNAAVEAARAGEQGRGFAVVASEVRSLAQRSAEAAREIKSLIGASVERVETGTRQVTDAGSTMAEIVASVQRVNDIISEISAATTEQSQGIGQVNTAVSDLDRMTQQNAALVEESAAAAESLNEQATRMGSLVATFKLQPAGR